MSADFWGDLICTLRREQKMSLRSLAERAKVPRGTLRRIEANEAKGTIDQIERLLDCLGYELDAIHVSSRVHRACSRVQH